MYPFDGSVEASKLTIRAPRSTRFKAIFVPIPQPTDHGAIILIYEHNSIDKYQVPTMRNHHEHGQM
jgi:hypothetical protein